MKLNTVIRLGALAFNVAQDDKVRELATIIHHGAKRRGIIAPVQAPRPPATVTAPSQTANIPFAPVAAAHQPSSTQPGSGLPAQTMPQFDVNQYLTMDNAKKVLGWAGSVSNLLVK